MRLALTYNVKDDSNGSGEYPEDHYAEWDDLETIEAVRDALKEKHEEVELIEADLDAYDKLRDLKPELVFNMAEGLTGESREAHIPAILEMLGIPYTGSSPLTLAMTLNKARSKQVLSYFSVPTPKFVVMENEKDFTLFTGNFPAMVKPLFEGSSKGIRNNSLVNSGSEMSEKVAEIIKEYKQPAIVEEFLPGRE
ncbi:MAG: D-alanine--D-alanine ligase, partial [Deltaproteobacteria bacterium]|nr:D-alanine--D-alanine ligase [Deltaproteobacteria bacterium]